MALVSITRLRLRGWRFLPGFALLARGAIAQARQARGYVGGGLLRDRDLTFWTLTVWERQEDMRRFMSSGAHLKAMPRLLDWCDEASVVQWTRPDASAPGLCEAGWSEAGWCEEDLCEEDWREADRRMRAEGRPSKVRRPSAAHAGLAYRAPRLSGATPLRRD